MTRRRDTSTSGPEMPRDSVAGNVPDSDAGHSPATSLNHGVDIVPELTLLDTVSRHRATEAVFRSRDAEAGVCLLCTHLFDSIQETARRRGLDLAALLLDLRQATAQEVRAADDHRGEPSDAPVAAHRVDPAETSD